MDKEGAIALTQFIALTGVATIAPFFHQQIITGTIVNATLFVTTAILGTRMGILVGLIPSIIALSVGTLSPVLAPMIPYIIISNAILILTFNFFKNKNHWLAIVLSSFLKFLFLYASSIFIVDLLFNKNIAKNVMILMSWPQLLTALLGGLLATLFLDFYKKGASSTSKSC